MHELGSQLTFPDDVMYCERFTEFLADLQSQLPTRRYVNALLRDLHVVPAVRLSPMYGDEDNSLLRDLHSLLCHYTFFPIDDHTFVQYNQAEAYERHCAELKKLQRVALQHFPEKLKLLALSNLSAIDTRADLTPLLEVLDDEELQRLATLLLLRISYPESLELPIDRRFLMDVIVSTHERRKNFQDMTRDMNLLPTEQTLFENSQTRSDDYDGSRPLALPKMKLQYLSVGDFLWRSLVLYRCESFHGVRESILAALRRLRPEHGRTGGVHFAGSSKMALPISKPT
jgi:intron-binding protein aquarius